jgi:hypothetical protein
MSGFFFRNMKTREQILKETLIGLPQTDLNLYLELGEHARKKGDNETSIFWFKNGFEMAKKLHDRSRIQQFSNILCSLIQV